MFDVAVGKDTHYIGICYLCLVALSILQTGPLPCFMTGEQLERLVLDCEKKFSDGLDVLGTMQVRKCVDIHDGSKQSRLLSQCDCWYGTVGFNVQLNTT